MGFLKVLLVLAGLALLALIVLPSMVRCIGEGTLVETPDGPRPVESLSVGDAVLAVTSEGRLAEARIVAIQRSVATRWRRLSIGGGPPLQLTGTHPVAGPFGWRRAGDLQAGQQVRTSRGLVPLQAAEARLGLLFVYDLSVDPHENFIAAGIVVHNKSIWAPESGAIGDARSVGSAQVAYSSSNGGAFGQLSCLGAPTSCGWPAGTAPFLDADITSLKPKQGYARSFLAGPVGKGKPDPGIETFVYAATPVKVGETGNRGFAIDHTGLICFTTDGTIPPLEKGALAPTCAPLK